MNKTIDLKASPPGINGKIWKEWTKRLATAYREADVNVSELQRVSSEMIQAVTRLQPGLRHPGKPGELPNMPYPPGFPTTLHIRWDRAIRSCVELWWQHLNGAHRKHLSDMACQRSGRCCMKGVPRISLYELRAIYLYLLELPHDQQELLKNQIDESLTKKYDDPIIGSGVPCPMLIKNEDGKHACAVHEVRPIICRLSAVSTPNSWDCPLWHVRPGRFDVMAPATIRPMMDLVYYARNFFSYLILHDETRCQMALLNVGILHLAHMNVPTHEQPGVTMLYPHREDYSDELYMRAMEASPTPEEK